jgi:hypothetical protein
LSADAAGLSGVGSFSSPQWQYSSANPANTGTGGGGGGGASSDSESAGDPVLYSTGSSTQKKVFSNFW